MQAPPSPIRLHWIPVEPSWLVAGGLVLLGSLPHQVPAAGRRMLCSPVSALLFAAFSAWVAWRAPVLGAAMFILLAGVVIAGPREEPFAAQTLNKDAVSKKQRWFVENTMGEKPSGIQDRTEGPALTFDDVDHPHTWEVERVMDEHPVAIQERPVPELPDYDESHTPYHS
jgi:hypothetical protein